MHHEENNDKKHYVCNGGCGGVSDKPGACQAEDCANHGKALEECGCHEEKHQVEGAVASSDK